jgi:hypothetical protein
MRGLLRGAAAVGGILSVVPVLFLSGCGLAAAPQPPSLKLPEPVKNLTASRSEDTVSLHWTMPKNTTDKVALKGDQKVHICRKIESGACRTAGDMLAAPDKPATFTDHLPAELASGTPRLLTYVIELQNHAGKTAGPSNAVYMATGAAPAAVTGLRAEVRAEGVVLHWDRAKMAPDMVLRIHRTLVSRPGAAKPVETAGVPPPEQETLEVDPESSDSENGDPGQALDRGAQLGRVWRYTAERVEKLTLETHPVETAGQAASAITIEAKDTFPPRVPMGLEAIADEQGHAIDLSWSPGTEPDLAGYVVYRRALTGGEAAPEKHAVTAPSFHDAAVKAGERYAYSVSAVDKDGNESARSAEVEEGLPQ